MNKLERLNQLLSENQEVLALPKFRSQVTDSGANLKFIKKALKNNAHAPEELRALSNLTFNDLLKPV